MQQLKLGNSNLGEINFVGKRMTRDNPQGNKILRKSGIDFSMNLEVKPLNTKNRGKLQYKKMQQVFHVESVFNELELVMRINKHKL
jgi:hypothetical protein